MDGERQGQEGDRLCSQSLLVGNSERIRDILALVEDFGPYDYPVLVLGPSGSGKRPVVEMIHAKSPRRDKPFVQINCAAFADTLIESQLFGVKARTVTGVEESKGLIAKAEGGTLFLDEVGELSEPAQAKLLTFLDTKMYYRVGDTELTEADVRIIAATNKDLLQEALAGRFREDLYFRLSRFIIETPALCGHPEDLPELVAEIIARHSAAVGGRVKCVSPGAMAVLEAYLFRGNVRELENVIIEAMAREKTDTIQVGTLRRAVREYRPPTPIDFPQGVLSPFDLACRDLAIRFMALANGKVSVAAEMIGIDRKTLTRWLKLFGLYPERKTA
jgi:two-component system response regulator HydG